MKKKSAMLIAALFVALSLPAQNMRFEITGYDADVLMEKGKKYTHEMTTHYDAKGKRQGPTAIYMRYNNGDPQTCLFRGVWKDDILVDSAVFYFRSGKKRQMVELAHDTAGAVEIFDSGFMPWYFRYEELRGKKQGVSAQWEEHTKNGNTYLYYSEIYCNNKRCDSAIKYHRNGKVYEKKVFDDAQNYKSTTRFHANGKLESKINYVNGKAEGEIVSYYPNGKKQGRTNYKNGKRVGLVQEWHPNGVLASSANYKNDERAGHYREFDSLGRKTIYRHFNETTFEEDSVNIEYYPSGKMKSRSQMKGDYHGLHQAWYPNGQLAEKGYYEERFKIGKWSYYDPTGKPISTPPDLNPDDQRYNTNVVGEMEYSPKEAAESYTDGYGLFWGGPSRLPELPLLNKNVTLQPAAGMQFMNSHPVVDVNAIIGLKGEISFTISTPLPENEKALLLTWLQANAQDTKPFMHFSREQSATVSFRIHTTK